MPLNNGNTDTRVLLSGAISVAPGDSIAGAGGAKTYHAMGTTTNGAGAATILVQGSMTGSAWVTLGTITLTLGTAATADSFSSNDRYALVRGNVTAISGTGASVSLVMGF